MLEEPSKGGRFHAPVSYLDVRRAYNTMRAAAGLGIAIGALVTWLTSSVSSAPWAIAAGLVMMIDGTYRRSHGSQAYTLLVIDITIAGVLLLTQGHTLSIEAAGFVYLLTAALLLLKRNEALMLIGFAAVWVPLITLVAPLGLLLSTVRALHQADERQREALETQRRAVEIKNEFVSMVSHERRTPPTSIAGFTDALRESWASLSDREIEEFLVIMQRETGHLRDLVEDILVIPRLETGHLRMDAEELNLRKESFDIADLVFQDSTMEFRHCNPRCADSPC